MQGKMQLQTYVQDLNKILAGIKENYRRFLLQGGKT